MALELLSSQDAFILSAATPLGSSREERQAYREAQESIRLSHRAWLENDYGTDTLSQRSRDVIYNKAWEDGHSNGFASVESEYQDLLDIVNIVLANK